MKSATKLKKILLASLKPVSRMSVSEWSDKYGMLPADSAEPGRYHTSRTPYAKEIMDAFTKSEIRRVVVKSSAQIGKSTILLCIVGRFAHLDPCTILILQPTLEMAADFSKARLSKLISDCKVLTPLFYEKAKSRDANQTILSKFFKGGRVVLAGANSPAGLASRPIKILLCDEVDRFPQSAASEGDPVDLASKRTTTYWDSKVALFSTPTREGASRIDVEYYLGTQEEWSHECPNCKEYVALDYRQMKVDFAEKRDASGNRTVAINSVRWLCPYCGFDYDESTLKNSPQKYLMRNESALKNGIRSFWISGFSSPWVSWSTIMREWLEAKGNPTRESVVYNTRFGLSYELKGQYESEEEFLSRREFYTGELPDGVLLLTAAVDVQANRLVYEVVGWGSGFERWGITYGVIAGEPNNPATWRALDDVLDRQYRFADGKALKVARTFIDSGYATAAVYAYCAQNMSKGRFAIKGRAGMGLPLIYQYSYPKHNPILLTILGVDDGKQQVMSNLSIEQGAGQMHFPFDDEYINRRGYDELYFKELIAEHKVIKRSGGMIYETWEKINPKERNEALDLAVYSLAAVKSCVGNADEKIFWQRRYELLQEPDLKKPPKKHRVVQYQQDIWV